ncbi:hypothetical protein [Nocardia exalbida]|uniref:hypothetical protein n=1 Tax=Nocardia exalbida TaxID=290231 RepID=UPI000593FB78|nr:hypothetical protein [Nocardia exalbida]
MVSIVNDRARLSGQRVFAAMGWPPGQPITYSTVGQIVAIRCAPPEKTRHAISPLGQIRLPAAVRHATGVAAGDHILLTAWPSASMVALIPSRIVLEALASTLTTMAGTA